MTLEQMQLLGDSNKFLLKKFVSKPKDVKALFLLKHTVTDS